MLNAVCAGTSSMGHSGHEAPAIPLAAIRAAMRDRR